MVSIFHIAERSQWQAAEADGVYQHPSLQTEGFIHCSTAEQVVWVANSFFRGQQGLVLLWIDSEQLGETLRYDEVEGVGAFPHVYGPIACNAVVQVLQFEPDADGTFALPQDVGQGWSSNG
ncbi:DUF952 domain-containing protein [Leptolyngbya sp. 7M]|uniref:DUF952 domain-containing protein n=1 Tax=Leptolyngbya sp. 7M TaxID=2812896 RepID=UPI001B8D512A|nr:DUF952 domain-containing protein [Leptolyngbya sp. 7M]QYO63789.1 DUF952 domain-containing protein [Leptolyngbya sp. 7M]